MKRAVAAALLLTACGATPLSNRIAPGSDPFVIGVGESPDGATDLYAVSAGNGAFTRLTFTRPEEKNPRLSPAGTSVAFFRRPPGGGPAWSLVVLNLLSSGERETAVGAEGGKGEMALGWSPDGRSIVVRDARGVLYRTGAPPAPLRLEPVPPDSTAAADSALRELLGEPPRGEVRPCPTGGLCLVAATGEATPLGAGVTGAIRWGGDSVGYFVPGGFEVLPLGGGRSRRPVWSDAPPRLRELTYHPGIRESPTAVPGISTGSPPSRP